MKNDKAKYFAFCHYCEGMNAAEIAKTEGVDLDSVRAAIDEYRQSHLDEIIRIKSIARYLLAARLYRDDLPEELRHYVLDKFKLDEKEIPTVKKTLVDYLTMCKISGMTPN